MRKSSVCADQLRYPAVQSGFRNTDDKFSHDAPLYKRLKALLGENVVQYLRFFLNINCYGILLSSQRRRKSRVMRKSPFCICENKDLISCAVTGVYRGVTISNLYLSSVVAEPGKCRTCSEKKQQIIFMEKS